MKYSEWDPLAPLPSGVRVGGETPTRNDLYAQRATLILEYPESSQAFELVGLFGDFVVDEEREDPYLSAFGDPPVRSLPGMSRPNVAVRIDARIGESTVFLDKLAGRDTMVAAVRTPPVLTEHLPPVRESATTIVEVEVPATWRDAWIYEHRDTWYGRLLARRWPYRPIMVRRPVTVTVDLARYRVYPLVSDLTVPGLGDPVRRHTLQVRCQGGAST